MTCYIRIAFSLLTTIALVYGTGILIFKPLDILVTKVGYADYNLGTSKLAEYLAWPYTILASRYETNEVLEAFAFHNRLTRSSERHLSPLAQEHPFSLHENVFLSRAFSQAMKPSRIIPFYYRASRSFRREDITIATLVTSNRFEVLVGLVQQYQGIFCPLIRLTIC